MPQMPARDDSLRFGGLAVLLFVLSAGFLPGATIAAPADDAAPPAQRLKLIFIHHSVGENWLTDGNGDLGRTLAKNNYFVSDTNYGWGPDGIGDRTDIVNWPEWFTGANSRRYLSAVYRESEQHSTYTRTHDDPGGENRIVLFKSCFPNSEIGGRPGDPPRRGDDLTVGNAKAIYNELLTAFAKRPDKLFIVITAPPVRDRTHAANARGFNTWLVQDWLKTYRGGNVAVFDFYNVLTGPGNHHRFVGGKVEHLAHRGKDSLHYPSDDDHPSSAGSRKATAEFVPLLNVFVRRWLKNPKASAPPPPEPESPPPAPPRPEEPATPPAEAPAPPPPRPPVPDRPASVLDDFEQGHDAWQIFSGGEGTRAVLTLDRKQAHDGKAGLRIEYDVAADGWATCSSVHDVRRDWRTKGGLVFYVRGERAGQTLDVIAYEGTSPDALQHREVKITLGAEAVRGWQRVALPWTRFAQPAWEGDGTARFDPSRAMGVAFAFPAPEGGRHKGRIWIDDVGFLPAK